MVSGFRSCLALSMGPVLTAVVIMAGFASVSDGATLTGIRHSTQTERTRIVLDLSAHDVYSHRTLQQPPRVVVELPGSTLGNGLKPRQVNNGFLQRIRINELRSGKIQVVLDLTKLLDYSIFTLSNPDRIVIDLKHVGSPVKATPPPATARTKDSKPKPRTPTRVTPPARDTWVVAIDAGHGGEDHGARHYKTSEKTITLELAKELKKALEKLPGIKPILVRKGDYYIPLRRRWTLAEKQGAHLFVSLHCNASKNKSIVGTELYFLSLKGATDTASKELEERENSVDEMMGIHVPETELNEIIFDMMQTDVLVKSQLLAEASLNSLFELGTVYTRGVKQAGFAVLKSPRMPSIMVEAAFISNRKENKLLRDEGWREDFGRRLADGIETYIQSVDHAEKIGTGQ